MPGAGWLTAFPVGAHARVYSERFGGSDDAVGSGGGPITQRRTVPGVLALGARNILGLRGGRPGFGEQDPRREGWDRLYERD